MFVVASYDSPEGSKFFLFFVRFFFPSVHPSVAHYIWGTVHHVIIIFVTHVQNDISWVFLIFFLILIFRAVMGAKGQKIAQNEKWKLHSSRAYLRNSIAFDHDFWYTRVKWWYLQVFFNFLKILIFRVKSGVKWQKIVCRAPYLRNHAYDCDLWYKW